MPLAEALESAISENPGFRAAPQNEPAEPTHRGVQSATGGHVLRDGRTAGQPAPLGSMRHETTLAAESSPTEPHVPPGHTVRLTTR